MEIYETIVPLHKGEPVRFWHIAVLFLLALIASASFGWARDSSVALTISILDIGQGDAILVSTEDGHQVLIDGGPDSSILSQLGEAMPSWDRTIDVVVATHRHSDHIAGLIEVLERYDVAQVVQGAETYDSATSRAWDAAVNIEGAFVTEALSGTAISLGSSISLTVLYPFSSRAGIETRDANEESVVLLLQHENVLMLLMGDAEEDSEHEMVRKNIIPIVDIVKAGHHGSKTSTTNQFLMASQPQVVVMSLGEGNRYGHPHQVTLTRLEALGIPYYRTDRNGDVTIRSDGRSFQITTER